ncbi:DNA-binding transcriptional LysR family regulator [Thermocatellispora tengchongensis]|uniref:DNA-binding transcriptional LysR family regulator n=1 Tax=Thermocatellispora tengchongensis TaxID=1073253 RepID=A0A840PIR6_9ACTN|nr:LysR substrate-binding domain-containing protein [Thermocatellispora tengchongensis]MBB5138869.1 DNA-binding transcriptional LysR family regulator [Thermocatellispora tengchongensis]
MAALLDLAQLRTFVAIADCGGFGRAASVLRTSQPTVSQHVRALERVVGRPLVERDGRTTRFTPAGEVLLAEARRLLAVHDEAMGRLGVERAPTLTFGATEQAADRLLPDLLGELRRGFPKLNVLFRLDRTTELLEAARRGALDLAMIVGAVPGGTAVEVGALPLCWLAAPGWAPPPRGDEIPLVAFQEPCGLRRQAVRALEDAGWLVQVTAEATNFGGVLAAARAGLGVALIPAPEDALPGLAGVARLPDQGAVPVHLAAREGLRPDVQEAASAVLRRFFAARELTAA